MFEWDSSMRIDGGPIDEQHKHLLKIANEIMSMNGHNLDVDKLKSLIIELYDYVKHHFEDEEKLMEKIGYPNLEEHKRLHSEIIDDMNFHLTNPKDIKAILVNFRRLVTRWLIDHILKEDRLIHAHMVKLSLISNSDH